MNERGREIDAAHVPKAELPPRNETIATAGADLRDRQLTVPPIHVKAAQTPNEFVPLLRRRLEPLIGEFPARGLCHD